jgi:hypothetical protein
VCVFLDMGNGVIRMEYYVQPLNEWEWISEAYFSIPCVCVCVCVCERERAVMSLIKWNATQHVYFVGKIVHVQRVNFIYYCVNGAAEINLWRDTCKWV